jgi:hypothetical protein
MARTMLEDLAAPQAQPREWRRWYKSARWQRRRAAQLQAEPWCRFHFKRDMHVPGVIADHIERHDGDPDQFWHGALQTLCRRCHESYKKFEEARGYLPDVDPATGYHLDPRHPSNLPRDTGKGR